MNPSLASLSVDLLKQVLEVSLKKGEKSETPWGESMQAAAPGADEIQLPDVDLRNPIDHYRSIRSLWALSLEKETEELKSAVELLLRHPLGKTFQPSVAIAYLLRRDFLKEEVRQPFAPTFFDANVVIAEIGSSWKEGKIPLLPELCQLALLWVLCGEEEAARRLITWLLPHLEFKTLWASERRYNKEEFFLSAYLLLSFLGKKEAALQALQNVDPFFLKLEKVLSQTHFSPISQEEEEISNLSFGSWLYSQGVVSLSGYNTSLGVFKTKTVEVCAFGPQSYPLTDSIGFGVRGIHSAIKLDKSSFHGWTTCFDQKEVWIEVDVHDASFSIQLRGLVPEKKMAFVFYVKAKEAKIEELRYQSKSLLRYNGVSQLVLFESLAIHFSHPRKIELIPLAGEGCFWGADFLLAIELTPSEPNINFKFEDSFKL